MNFRIKKDMRNTNKNFSEIEVVKLELKDKADRRKILYKTFCFIAIIIVVLVMLFLNKDELLKQVISFLAGSGVTYGFVEIKKRINSS